MPFIRLNLYVEQSSVDVNINTIIAFEVRPGDKFTTVCLRDNLNYEVSDTPRSIRGYIKRAEGLLPEKVEVQHAGWEPTDEDIGRVMQDAGKA